jgi:DNA polymerase gamma 1
LDAISDPVTLNRLVNYCALDVKATHELLTILLPKFLAKCPHPASFAGMMHMVKGFLPITKDWVAFVNEAESKCNEYQSLIEKRLLTLARKALSTDSTKIISDPWLKNLDWEVSKSRRKDQLPFDANSNHTIRKELALAPKWYKDFWDSKLKRIRLTTSKRASPYLLKLHWNGYPLYYSSLYGWTYRVPKANLDVSGLSSVLEFSSDPSSEAYDPVASIDDSHIYLRIPHPEGEGKNCGNPLAKNYLAAFENGTLSSEYPDAKEILGLNAQCSYWVSARQRIKDQFVVWNDSSKSLVGDVCAPDGSEVGVILPQSIPMGTVTRRAVEATWMTAANAKSDRIGSELKSLIKSPKGYRFIGADVDSQELWIASLLGDAQFGIHGASAIGFMTLQGTKSMKTVDRYF